MSAQLNELVLKAKAGDADAFGELYTIYYKEMYAYACCVVGDSFFAQDAVSDAVLSAFKGISGLKKPESFKGWLFKILNASCKNQYNKMKSTLQLDENYDVATGGGLEDLDLSQDLKAAMEVLSREERQIIFLSITCGEKSHDIAAILDMPAATVRSKQKRALAKMRVRLSGYENNEKGGADDE